MPFVLLRFLETKHSRTIKLAAAGDAFKTAFCLEVSKSVAISS